MKTPLPDELTRISPWRSALALALDWAIIIACFSAAMRVPHPLTYVIAAILIARTQLALAVLMHESAHGVFHPNRRVNDFFGQLFAAAPLSMSLFSYRAGHLQHHRVPMAANDPVAVVFGIADYPVSRGELAWRLLKDVTGIGYVLSLRDFAQGKFRHVLPPRKPSPSTTALVLGSILAAHAALLGVLHAAGHAMLYVGLWLLPSLTLLQVFARIRAITEHAGYPYSDDQMQNARSIVRPNWQTFFCGPHAIHYHIEHHQHVRVPFYRLRQVHDYLAAQGVLPAPNLYRGYGQVLRDVTR